MAFAETGCTRSFQLTHEGRGISQCTSAASSGRTADGIGVSPTFDGSTAAMGTSTVRLDDDWRATPIVDRDGAGGPLPEWTAMVQRGAGPGGTRGKMTELLLSDQLLLARPAPPLAASIDLG